MRQLTMKFAGGGIVRHLGLQNYKGPVPALAELISNSWDADAGEVHISIPLGKQLEPNDIIIVEDDGFGMSWSDCDEKYLVIGRNRRVAEKRDRTPSGRPLMAHKGLGKLAGFGIANVVEIRTVNDGKLTHFSMNFSVIDKLNQGETYEPKMIHDEVDVEEPNSTVVTLREISLQRAISREGFFESIASRFAVLSDKFTVYINDELLKKEQVPLEFRFPEQGDEDVIELVDGWGKTNLPPEITWWIGFQDKPIQIEGAKGVNVITRGKSSQDPWDFDLEGGTWGQHGLRYMIGEIVADFLDEGLEKENDLIITNRSSIMWDHPKARPLYEWARKKIRQLLREWASRRGDKTYERVTQKYPELIRKINQFQPREKRELNSALRSLAQVPDIDEDRLSGIFGYIIDGYVDKSFVGMLEEFKDLPPEDRVRMLEILREFDVSEAIRVHGIVSAHVRVIRTFREMIEAGVPEKPDMHEHIRKYPWLLGIRYQTLDYDRSLQKILEDHFGVKPMDKGGRIRPDFTCMRSGNDVVVLELKRPNVIVGPDELKQISDYVDYLREWAGRGNAEELVGTKISREDIIGFLIVHDVRDEPGVRGELRRLERDRIHVVKWYDLLRKTEDEHRVFLSIVKSRAPEDDPRVKEIEEKEII